jgi:hypothetical protein
MMLSPRICVAALVTVGLLTLGLVSAGNVQGHPNGVWRTPAQAEKPFFSPGKHKFDDKSIRCRGSGPSLNGKYRHFICLTTRNDGYVFSTYIHTTADGGWEFSENRVVRGDPSPVRVIANKTATGDFATVVTSGSVDSPYVIYVRAIAKPDQAIRVNWSAVCSKSDSSGTGAASKKGSYRDYSRVDHKIELPMFFPDQCTVAASGSLARGGAVTVKIIAILQT